MWAARVRERVPEIRQGDKRTIRRFALWPTLVDTEEDPPVWVWWEWYFLYQEFHWAVVGQFE